MRDRNTKFVACKLFQGRIQGVTSHPSHEREKYITKNITSQATLLANERV